MRQRETRFGHILGLKFHYLTVTGFRLKQPIGWLALVTCDCGRTSETIPRSLIKGMVKTCGQNGCQFFHLLRRKAAKKSKFTGHQEIFGSRWAAWRCGAEKRKIPFLITIEEAWGKFIAQNRRCALTGIELYFGTSWDRKFTASLDRIDPAKPYIKDNVQWVHKRVNLLKSNLTEDELRFWCRLVSGFEAGLEPPTLEVVERYERPVRGCNSWKKRKKLTDPVSNS